MKSASDSGTGSQCTMMGPESGIEDTRSVLVAESGITGPRSRTFD